MWRDYSIPILKYSFCRVEEEGSITTLGYALLALLAQQASSGYDLARRLKRPIGFFWSAHQSHIYSELTRLEDQGLIAHQVIEQSNRPDKKLFWVTDAGLAVLRVAAGKASHPTRAGHAHPPRGPTRLRRFVAECRSP